MTTTKNNIPVGYKDSAVGIIPQEWEVATLGKLVSIASGESPSLFNLRNIGKYPYIKVEDMNNCEKYQSFSREYTDDERCAIPKGSIIFPKRGAAIINNKVRIANCALYMDSNMMAITPNDLACGDYLYFKIIHEQLFKIADTSTIPQINNKHIIPYKICLPPMAEQKKIAEILGIWDEAIEKQNLLIEKLELRKRALMQRLLTGRIRLPGFIDDVQYKKLKPLIVEKSERNTNQTYTNVLSVTNNRGFINQAEQFDREVASDNTANYKLVHRGQFAYNPSRVNVGSLDLLQTYDLGILIPMYIVFETRPTMDSKFLYYQLKSGWFVGHIPMYVQGSVRDSLSFDGLENMKFWIPSLTEQKAIAEVLNTADKEIAIHSKTLDALRLQKRGLMQQLLTGKTRVKI
ncbi:MAG: restriction endonuclease subunit S [Bacteroidales bacterium]|nr:restriction endonuclease subunit S [Bacteroidales bacterium]